MALGNIGFPNIKLCGAIPQNGYMSRYDGRTNIAFWGSGAILKTQSFRSKVEVKIFCRARGDLHVCLLFGNAKPLFHAHVHWRLVLGQKELCNFFGSK
jgi:hypothetical protein